MDKVSDLLIMEFDPNTIEHLGIHMYSTLPPVIAELVSNSYDADAKTVDIFLYDTTDKKIVIKDTGHGMTYKDIQQKFLVIGRNRRIVDSGTLQTSESGRRTVIGKKGIGKLSFFGIASIVEVETVRDSKINIFRMELEMLKRTRKNYEPRLIKKDKKTQEKRGTKITLTDLKRKTPFDPNNVAYHLAKTFSVFNEADFNVRVIHNEDETNAITIKNELRFQNLTTEFEWNFPLDIGIKYEYEGKVTGKIISSEDTVPAALQGFALYSRGKLVNEPEFYDEKATSFGYSYLTGWLNVDFIDDWNKDIISTNRRSLNWEDEDAGKLRGYLNEIVRYIYRERVKKRKEKQVKLISEKAKINIENWIKSLPRHEGKLASKLVDSILNAEGLPTDKQTDLVKYVKDSFQFEAFKMIVNEFENKAVLSSDKILDLFKEWELIEAREMYKLATGRIEAIKTLERLIDENAKEVEKMQPFFRKFPWILDPRINMFRPELQYAKILKENFPEKELDEKNRRIDFLCTSVSNHRFIIELKRPHHEIKLNDIDQAKDYRGFIEEYCNTDKFSPNKVIAFVVGGKINYDDRKTRDEIQSMQDTDKVYVRTYSQLLTNARNYHQEFIDRYEEIEKSKIV